MVNTINWLMHRKRLESGQVLNLEILRWLLNRLQRAKQSLWRNQLHRIYYQNSSERIVSIV